MLIRLLPWLFALAAFVGVGLYVTDNQATISFRNAEAVRDFCYADKGFADLSNTNVTIPDAIIDECTKPIADWESSPAPFIIGGIAGLIAAAIVLGIFLLLRRRKAA